MKKQLLFFIFLLSSITGFSQCNYSFVMSSSGTTGWNGNTMKVRQNGVTVATIGATFTTGSGPQTATVSLQDNIPFDLFWNTGGTIPSQIKISITNSFGQTIYTKPPTVTTQNTILYSGTTDCTQPACIPPASLSIGNITTDAVTLSWTNDPTVTKWEALALPQASPAPSAGTAGIETTTNSIFINGLTCNTTYKAYVRSICGVSATPSAWVMVGSTTFKTLICNAAPMTTCVGANSLCGTFGTVYANTTNVATQGTLGCLTTSPNATWFYFSVATPGQINLEIKQSTLADMSTANLDVDYVIYGPYSQIIAPCSGQLTPDKIVSCSYSAAPTEFPSFTVSQTGQYYYLAVTNFNNGAGFIRISELPTTTASLDCKGFRLNAFIDNNANGVKDAGEQSFPNGQFQYEKNNDGSVHNVTTPVGVLNIYESNPTNSYDFAYQINPDYASYYNLPSSAYNDVLINGAGLTDYNFPVTVTNLYNDASVSLASMEQPRPGFLYRNKVIYTNNGNQVIANGTVSFTKDTALSITNISQAGTVATANGFTYDFTNLLPFETRTIEVTMQVPNIPTVQLGNLIHNTASISISNDAIVGNNNFGLSQEIIGSYDPNDVMEAHGEQILYSGFTSDDYLYYTVRFENTGTAAAINVKVHNALNSKLDETSLKIVSASHNYVMDRVGTSVDWDFKSIVLSATSQNPNTSKGYIVYKIKPKAGYVVGDIIPNTASIYFDYNPAIVTNTFNTEFVSQLSVDEFENNNFVFYPNPAHDMITVAVKNSIDEISEIKLYDLSGKIVLAKSYSTIKISETVDLSKVSKGMYFIEVQTKSNLKMIKKLLIE